MKSILVPVDGSASANRAARFAAKLAAPLGSKLTLFYAYDAPAASLLGLAGQGGDAVKEALKNISRKSFDTAQAAIEEERSLGGLAEIEVDTRATTGHPAEEIIARAKSSKCDLVVMGSRGLSPLREIAMGSVSDRVLRFAPCAVTIVR